MTETSPEPPPLAVACAGYGAMLPGGESNRDATDAQTLHDSPGSDLDEAERDDVLRMRREMAYEAGDDFAGRPRDSMEDGE